MALSGVTLTGAQGASAVLLFGGGIDFRATEVLTSVTLLGNPDAQARRVRRRVDIDSVTRFEWQLVDE